MKTLISALFVCSLLFSASIVFASSHAPDLEKRLMQQERRIDRLERQVEALQGQLMDAQYGDQGSSSSSRAKDRNTIDPLVGNWECTDNVFTYDISFFENGRLVQEEPFFSKAKGGRWSRLSGDRFATDQGVTFSVDFRSDDELNVTNLTNNNLWNCSRK